MGKSNDDTKQDGMFYSSPAPYEICSDNGFTMSRSKGMEGTKYYSKTKSNKDNT